MIGGDARRAWPFGLVVLLAPGCFPVIDGEGAELKVATAWPDGDRRELERAFVEWYQARGASTNRTPRIRWVEADGDVRLGGPIADHPSGAAVVRRVRIGLIGGEQADRPSTWDALSAPQNAGRLAIGDPRHDPIPLELAVRWSEADGLAAALERLGRLYARSALIPVGRAESAVDRGRADWALVARSDSPLEPAVELEEGASLGPSARDESLAEAFLNFLRDYDRQPEFLPESRASRELLADLLGSILVDAHDDSGRMARGLPPWPPASIRELRDREDGDGLVQLLAEQLVPDVEARIWLLQSWDEDGRVDEGRLAALAEAAEGGLLREPRFRAWLRGEWNAWARASAGAMGAPP